MADIGRFDDDSTVRLVDRVRAITFKQARDSFVKSLQRTSGVDRNLFSRSWIAKKIRRSETFVKIHWERDPYAVEDAAKAGAPLKLSQASVKIIEDNSNKKKRSNKVVAEEILKKRGKEINPRLVGRYRQRLGLTPFHELKKPNITPQNREDRLWFCEYLSNWDEDAFLNLAVSDEFYLYVDRRPNSRNDVIWARGTEEIPDDVRYRLVGAHPACYGIFVCFTAVRVFWVAKEAGQSWNGDYFRAMLSNELIPFLKDPENIVDADSLVFLHDRAPCMSALATQALLKNSGIDFFGNSEWPGHSPDLNPTENLGAIIKERVERLMIERQTRSLDDMKQLFRSVIDEINNDTTLLQTLLRSMRRRLDAVVAAQGGPTKY